MGPLSSPAVTARVVVVDDDDEVREVTEMVLAGAGHSVRATANGFEALRWLEEQPWDLLILDLRMPEIEYKQRLSGRVVLSMRSSNPLACRRISGGGTSRRWREASST
jgi:CheY-like chemotaxis protein